MKTSEMIAMLEKNPKLKFVCKHGVRFSGFIKLPDIIDEEWVLVDQSVPAWKAIQVLQEGKTIEWRLGSDEVVFRPDGAWFITKVNINYGKWYIKEDE